MSRNMKYFRRVFWGYVFGVVSVVAISQIAQNFSNCLEGLRIKIARLLIVRPTCGDCVLIEGSNHVVIKLCEKHKILVQPQKPDIRDEGVK